MTHITKKFSGILYLGKSPAISIYWYHRVRSSTSRVRSSAEKFCHGFGWVRSSTSRVRSSSKFDIFGFDPTLVPSLIRYLTPIVPCPHHNNGCWNQLRIDKIRNAQVVFFFKNTMLYDLTLLMGLRGQSSTNQRPAISRLPELYCIGFIISGCCVCMLNA